ncbi:MAG: tRNA (N6-isopentenyl adenosine(37)-C2)-methylthiotransferase MiaB [Clostridiales bacterium]|nr:tRNA (N6-isopentenyl adenosine(37)-C2)-methylthiotransferase MiaB [Clostridiales bacterium]
MGKSYYISTFGCQMNVHESEKLAGLLSVRGYFEALSPEKADVIVFNTCCIRETAETRIAGRLGNLKRIKEENPRVILAVCGCMTQKKGGAEALIKRFPYIDIIFGTHNLTQFGAYLDAYEGKKTVEIWEKETPGEEDGTAVKRAGTVNAWVNIMYGCNNFCSYCIVPYVRGRERSRKKADILADMRGLLDEGYKEITLLGQNVNSYGEPGGFSGLLADAAALSGTFKLKFMTSHPKDLTEDVVRVMAMSDKLAAHIHLPVQSGSDRVLSLMNRKYTGKKYLETIDMIRKYLPNAGLSSDVMVGFPTETEADFLDTVRLVETVRFSNLFTFIYSRRSGTPAADMAQIPYKVKQERIARLIARQKEIGPALAGEAVGRVFTVLCEEIHGGVARGKTQCEREMTFPADGVKPGDFVRVRALRHKNTGLIGELV